MLSSLPPLHVPVRASALLALACGCGGAAPAGAPQHVPTVAVAPAAPATPTASSRAPAPSSRVSGEVSGRRLTVKSAAFLWRQGADDLTVILADAGDVCGTVTAGAWPRGATMLRATLKQGGELRDAPFGGGDYPLRDGGARRPRETKQAAFTALDDACAPVVGAKATAGVVRLSTPAVTVGGVAEGTFELTMQGGERVDGAFVATHCPTPDLEPRGCR